MKVQNEQKFEGKRMGNIRKEKQNIIIHANVLLLFKVSIPVIKLVRECEFALRLGELI